VLILAGCNAQAPEVANQQSGELPRPADTMSGRNSESSSNIVLARLPDSREGLFAAVPGTIRVRNDCVYLEDLGGRLLLLAVTNPDLQWVPSSRAILSGSVFIREGDKVVASGARAMADAIKSLNWKVPPPSRCTQERIVIVHQLSREPMSGAK